MKTNKTFWTWSAIGVSVLLLGYLILTQFSSDQGPLPLVRDIKAVSDHDLEEELVRAQSYFLEWRRLKYSQGEMEDFYRNISKEEPLVLTVRAYGKPNLDQSYGAVLNSTSQGKYDDAIRKLAEKLKEHHAPVYLRWCEAMEVHSERYPWQLKYHKLYTDAYRHFVATARAVNPDLKFIWGPAGYPGLEEYWPGNDVVDLISLDIGHISEKDSDAYPPYVSVEEELYRKVHRLRFFERPVAVFAFEDTPNQAVKDALEIALSSQKELAHIPINSVAPPLASDAFRIGVYDPENLLNDLSGVNTEHFFVNWSDLENGPFRTDFKAALGRGHEVIVSVEPFKDPNFGHDKAVLSNTQNGDYDQYIQQLYDILSETDQTIYLRFAHEMEIPIERYPWQSQDPKDYISAYRYFMNFPETSPTNIKRV
ncbi:MAG: hypothetical protein KI786_07755 [Mameliella sp.]|nr:hypothetical protein [Phaeodactylibacter sp.]